MDELARRGVNTNDDLRFLRLSWEASGSQWVLHVKGGAWIFVSDADPHMLLNWGDDGNELLAERVTARAYKFAIVPSRELYRHPGLPVARRAWSLKRSLDTTSETSHAFLLPPGLNEHVTGVDRDAVARELQAIQREIDEAAFGLYAIGREERDAIEAASTRAATTDDSEAEPSGDEEDDDANDDAAPVAAAADALVHGSSASSFGRFDSLLANGSTRDPDRTRAVRSAPGALARACTPEGEDARHRSRTSWSTTQVTRHDLSARTSRASQIGVRVDVPRAISARGSRRSSSRCTSRCTRRAVARRRSTGSSRRPRRATRSGSTSTPSRKDTLFRVQNDYVAPEARA